MKRYTFRYSICLECGAAVADNWYIRHVRSGCKIGASKSGLAPLQPDGSGSVLADETDIPVVPLNTTVKPLKERYGYTESVSW